MINDNWSRRRIARIASNPILLNFGRTRPTGRSSHGIGDGWIYALTVLAFAAYRYPIRFAIQPLREALRSIASYLRQPLASGNSFIEAVRLPSPATWVKPNCGTSTSALSQQRLI